MRSKVWAPALLWMSYLLVAILSSSRAVLRPGWPLNHEHLAPFERVECFRRAFASGVWLPTWSPEPFTGYGSPFPLLYHRLFSSVGGLIALVTQNSVLAVRLLIPTLLVVGGLGTYRLCRVLGASRPLSWAGGILLMLAPYTILDWLVRGAVAEFTAAMLFPCWLSLLLQFLNGERHWVQFAGLTALLFHGHSVLCLFSLPLALAVFAIALASGALALKTLRAEAWQIASAALVLILGVVPFALAIRRVMPSVNTQFFINFTSPGREFLPFEGYLVDDSFAWGTRFRGVSPEVNRYLVLTALGFAAAAAVLGRRLERATTRLLLGALFVYVYLQLPTSNWFYLHVPGALYLQFPWRLNALITPILIALVCVAGQSCASGSRRARWGVLLAMATCVALSVRIPWQALRLDYPRFSEDEIVARVSALSDDVAGVEYLPKDFEVESLPGKRRGKRRRRGALSFFAGAAPSDQPFVSGSCVHDAPKGFVNGSLSIEVDEPTECELVIRQFQSPVLDLELTNASLLSEATEPGYRIALHPGRSRVTLRQKSVARLALEALSHAP